MPNLKFRFPEIYSLTIGKKIPGRQSGLPLSRKWENTQITFNTDKEIFLNSFS